MSKLQIKRVYDPPSDEDGLRVLVDRLWPRGVTKQTASIDVWAKELAPSVELRRWFGHKAEKYDEFTRRYREELQESVERAKSLIQSAEGGVITLVYAARSQNNHAAILCRWLTEHQ